MKHTGDVRQAGKAMMDELNTLHRMSQGQQGVAEGEYNPDTFVGKKGTYKGYGITQEGPHQWGISSSVRKFSTLAAAKRHIDKVLVVSEQGVAEVSDATKQSYKEKAQAQVRELEPYAKKGEYKDIAQRAIDRRQKGLARVPDEQDKINDHIVKVKGGYELKSKHGNKNLGKYPTRAGAEKRERQVQYFKHAGEEVNTEDKIKGVDGKACWKGKRYAGKVKKADGTYKDKCVPVSENVENIMGALIDRIIVNEAISHNKR
jgi:hypothetical protein